MQDETCYENFLIQNQYPRVLTSHDSVDHSSIHVTVKNKKLINFSSNDYLGLAHHPLVIQRSQQFVEQYGAGASSSRLVTGNVSFYDVLEKQLAGLIGKPAALIFATGFQTNYSVLAALLDAAVLKQKPLIFCDKLCHVSLLLGAQTAGRLQRFQHNDLQHLEDLLKKYSDNHSLKFIIVESIYSMDGDSANLPELITLAKKYNAMLYVDDAHATGVYGFGKAVPYSDDIDIIMGTFSKAWGSLGGYIGCSLTIKNYLINKCKGLIYSTALPPAILGAISAAIEISPKLEGARARVLAHAKRLRDFFQQQKLDCGASISHIVPWIIGDAQKTFYMSQLLEEQGILAATIRPPTVPIGRSRIRFCLSAAHSAEDIDQLISGLENISINKK